MNFSLFVTDNPNDNASSIRRPTDARAPPTDTHTVMKSAVYLLALLAAACAAPAAEPEPAAQPRPAAEPQPDPADDSKPEIIEIIAPAASAQVNK